MSQRPALLGRRVFAPRQEVIRNLHVECKERSPIGFHRREQNAVALLADLNLLHFVRELQILRQPHRLVAPIAEDGRPPADYAAARAGGALVSGSLPRARRRAALHRLTSLCRAYAIVKSAFLPRLWPIAARAHRLASSPSTTRRR